MILCAKNAAADWAVAMCKSATRMNTDQTMTMIIIMDTTMTMATTMITITGARR